MGWKTDCTAYRFQFQWLPQLTESMKIRRLFIFATGTESTDNHAFRVGLDGKNLIQMTSGEGTHNLSISPKGSYFIDTWSSITSSGSIIAYDKKGKNLKEIYKFEQPVRSCKKFKTGNG